jgi:hypothetical protein
MPKRIKKATQKRALPQDVNQRAAALVALTTKEPPDFKAQLSEYMSKLGRKGGRVSGRTRREWLPEERRKEIASIAAKARWAKRKTEG